MRDRSSTEHTHPAENAPGTRFARSFRGYRRNLVDDAMTRLELRVADLEQQSVELREELLDSQHVASEARHDLTRARAELRYWNDRASYVDSEVARARQRATELEAAARSRAEAIEADAQERSLHLVDRVCSEANAIMQAAREEAREMFLRFETDVDMSQQKLDKLEQVRVEVASTMQGALNQFEEAVRELDKVAPAKRIVTALEAPTRRSVPTFGKKKALEAARRFDEGIERVANAALSTPVPESISQGAPTVLSASVSDVVEADEPIAPILVDLNGTPAGHAQATTEPVESHRQHDADDEFAALLMQP
jgi:chromosome segregation ATPase